MKKLPDIKNVGLTANPEKADCSRIVRQAAALISNAGRRVLSDSVTADLAGLQPPASQNVDELTGQVDLLVVFGGDGTMLRVARDVAGSATPLLGINLGGLGFLTAASFGEMERAFSQLWEGQFTVETRPLIEATGKAQGKPVSQIALNDFVISRGAIPRLIELEVTVDGASLTRYRCDGLIVSSPTGSTAYSLAAGGAVVCPDAEVFTLTPISPHTLSNRSVIVNLRSVIEVGVLSGKVDTVLSADGQVQIGLGGGDVITMRRSPKSVRLVRLSGSSFFSTLRQKFNWSGSNV